MEKKLPKYIPNRLGFMTKDGRGYPCIISTEISEGIATGEGLPKSKPQPISSEKRIGIEERIIASIPEEDRGYLSDILQKTHGELDCPENTSCSDNSVRRRLRISDNYSFEIVEGRLIGYHGKNDKIVLIPHGVSTIGESAFGRENSESIKTIILPETVVNIEKDAFIGCSKLRYINFPTSLRNIGLRPFISERYDCRLKYLYIPDDVLICDCLGSGLKMETLRLPLHLFNDTDCIDGTKVHTLIIGLPEEDGMTSSQAKVDLHKIKKLRTGSHIVLEQYVSSHLSKDTQYGPHVYTVDGFTLLSDSNGRDYIPEEDSDRGLTYVVSIPGDGFVVPESANVLDSKCGWHHQAPLLYIPPTIEYIAPDAFRWETNFITPRYNEQKLRNILSTVKFSYHIITI